MKHLRTPASEHRKGVDYCYPSSPHAERFGYARTGCYVCCLIDREFNSTVVSAHATREAAFDAAAALPNAWHPLWRRYDQEDQDAADARFAAHTATTR